MSDSYDIGRLSAQVFAHQREIIALREELEEWKREVQTLERNAETTYENHKRIVAELTAERDEAKKEIKSLEDLLEDYRRDLNGYQWREDNLRD